MKPNSENRKPRTVIVLQLVPRRNSPAHGIPVRATTIVYGNEAACVDGLCKLIKAECNRLKQQEKYERDLGFDASTERWSDGYGFSEGLTNWSDWRDMLSDHKDHLDRAKLLEHLAKIPDDSKLWDITVTEERVIY